MRLQATPESSDYNKGQKFFQKNLLIFFTVKIFMIRETGMARRRTRKEGDVSDGLCAPEPRDVDRASYVGKEIRILRKARGMTLAQVAEKTALSVGYLSHIERNMATPSMDALLSLSKALRVDAAWFFKAGPEADDTDQFFVVRADSRRQLRYGRGIVDYLLVPDLTGSVEFLLMHMEPGADSGDEQMTHRGEMVGLVLSGALRLQVAKRELHLNKGDSFRFDTSTSYRYSNPSPDQTVVVIGITPPA